jgi:hypothetical protein
MDGKSAVVADLHAGVAILSPTMPATINTSQDAACDIERSSRQTRTLRPLARRER